MEAKDDSQVFQFDKVDQEVIYWDKNEQEKRVESKADNLPCMQKTPLKRQKL